MTCDFQQCDILTSIDLDQPVQPPFKLRNSKWRSFSSLTVIEYKATSKGSHQTARMRRLVWAFAGRTYHIVGNLMSPLIYRGSYMSAHVLLNLLNKLGKRDKMWGLPSILSLFRNKINKFNNVRAQMLDSIHHMTLRLFWNLISAVKSYNFFITVVSNVVLDLKTFPVNLYRFYCMALFRSQMRCHIGFQASLGI